MKVLMFGWEFPPQITGGLGTACYGITKSLARLNVKILLVVPKTFGNEDRRYLTLQDAGEIPSKYRKSGFKKSWRMVKYKEIQANLFPYMYLETNNDKTGKDSTYMKSGGHTENPDFFPFSGKYGNDLLGEVERYSKVTYILAGKENYNIIQAHDWLTFPAAISAKKISSKPFRATYQGQVITRTKKF